MPIQQSTTKNPYINQTKNENTRNKYSSNKVRTQHFYDRIVWQDKGLNRMQVSVGWKFRNDDRTRWVYQYMYFDCRFIWLRKTLQYQTQTTVNPNDMSFIVELFVGELMFYLCYFLCLLAHSSVQHIFVLLLFVSRWRARGWQFSPVTSGSLYQ
jgi:hypothetical protein